MAGFCRVSLMGFLGSDPETRYTPNGVMNVNFSVAVTGFKRQSDPEEPKPVWYRITAWDRNAETIDKLAQQGHIAKGRPLYVEGKLEPRQFMGNDGQPRTSYDVTMTAWEFVGTREDQRGGQGQGSGGYNQNQGQSSGGYNQDQGQQNRGQQDSGNSRNQAPDGFDDDPGPSNIDDVPF